MLPLEIKVTAVFDRAPVSAAPRSVASSDDAAPKAMSQAEPSLKVNEPTVSIFMKYIF